MISLNEILHKKAWYGVLRSDYTAAYGGRFYPGMQVNMGDIVGLRNLAAQYASKSRMHKFALCNSFTNKEKGVRAFEVHEFHLTTQCLRTLRV